MLCFLFAEVWGFRGLEVGRSQLEEIERLGIFTEAVITLFGSRGLQTSLLISLLCVTPNITRGSFNLKFMFLLNKTEKKFTDNQKQIYKEMC